MSVCGGGGGGGGGWERLTYCWTCKHDRTSDFFLDHFFHKVMCDFYVTRGITFNISQYFIDWCLCECLQKSEKRKGDIKKNVFDFD
jgi:hypothetical protein